MRHDRFIFVNGATKSPYTLYSNEVLDNKASLGIFKSTETKEEPDLAHKEHMEFAFSLIEKTILETIKAP